MKEIDSSGGGQKDVEYPYNIKQINLAVAEIILCNDLIF